MSEVRIIRAPAASDEIQAMLEALGTYIKLAVDVGRGVLAGGGEYHADCEELLLADGSRQDDIWGADWHPDTRRGLRCAHQHQACSGQPQP